MIRRATFQAFATVFNWFFGTAVARAIWTIPGSKPLYRYLITRLRPAVVRVDGHVMRLDPMDSLLLSVNGSYEDTEVALFKNCLDQGDVVLDIGAHIGLYTLQAARAVGPGGRVVGFEPSVENYALLQANIVENGYTNVELVMCAVAEVAGQRLLALSSDNAGDHSLATAATADRQTQQVETVTIDAYLSAGPLRVDVIKMDIQGAEPLAIAGARTTLAANDDVILFTELSPGHLQGSGGAAAYLATLQGLGFELMIIDETAGSVRAASEDELATVCASTTRDLHLNLLCVKGRHAHAKVDAAIFATVP